MLNSLWPHRYLWNDVFVAFVWLYYVNECWLITYGLLCNKSLWLGFKLYIPVLNSYKKWQSIYPSFSFRHFLIKKIMSGVINVKEMNLFWEINLEPLAHYLNLALKCSISSQVIPCWFNPRENAIVCLILPATISHSSWLVFVKLLS